MVDCRVQGVSTGGCSSHEQTRRMTRRAKIRLFCPVLIYFDIFRWSTSKIVSSRGEIDSYVSRNGGREKTAKNIINIILLWPKHLLPWNETHTFAKAKSTCRNSGAPNTKAPWHVMHESLLFLLLRSPAAGRIECVRACINSPISCMYRTTYMSCYSTYAAAHQRIFYVAFFGLVIQFPFVSRNKEKKRRQKKRVEGKNWNWLSRWYDSLHPLDAAA